MGTMNNKKTAGRPRPSQHVSNARHREEIAHGAQAAAGSRRPEGETRELVEQAAFLLTLLGAELIEPAPIGDFEVTQPGFFGVHPHA